MSQAEAFLLESTPQIPRRGLHRTAAWGSVLGAPDEQEKETLPLAVYKGLRAEELRLIDGAVIGGRIACHVYHLGRSFFQKGVSREEIAYWCGVKKEAEYPWFREWRTHAVSPYSRLPDEYPPVEVSHFNFRKLESLYQHRFGNLAYLSQEDLVDAIVAAAARCIPDGALARAEDPRGTKRPNGIVGRRITDRFPLQDLPQPSSLSLEWTRALSTSGKKHALASEFMRACEKMFSKDFPRKEPEESRTLYLQRAARIRHRWAVRVAVGHIINIRHGHSRHWH